MTQIISAEQRERWRKEAHDANGVHQGRIIMLLDALKTAEDDRDWFRAQADYHIGRANRAEQALGRARE